MIDDAVILFTTIMCMLVVLRAIRLDTRLPWFGEGWRPRGRAAQSAPQEAPAEPPTPPRWGGGWDSSPDSSPWGRDGVKSQRDVP